MAAAAQEERFNRTKNSSDFPINAINFCIQTSGISFYDIDYIGFYEKPFLKFSRVILEHVRAYPFSLKNFLDTLPNWLEDRLIIPLVLKREFDFKGKTVFIKHHLSHAASAFLVSPFEEAAILTSDGVGEWATATYGSGTGNQIKIIKEMRYPDSLGLLYTAITTYLGLEAMEGEGKVMGLAGYGKPRYMNEFKEIICRRSDGSFKINPVFFGFNRGRRMYSKRFVRLFGKPRFPGNEMEERYCDIAATLQKFTEDTIILMAKKAYENTKKDNLCLAGGVFLNCLVNHKILEETPFKEIFIQPAAGDSGGALGTAVFINNSILANSRNYVMESAALGPEFTKAQIKTALLNNNLDFKEFEESQMLKFIAKKISENNVIGWLQGRMEFGPRALGNRSILANPCNPGMKELLNTKVKHRESFRPYAPAVLEEKTKDFFCLKQNSPFMLLACKVKEEKRRIIPAVTHVDDTARIQTVNREKNPKFWQLIKEFEDLTGVPIIINTSFNLRGEPIVCSPQDAINCFKKTQMDYLVLDNYVVGKQ